MKKTLIFIIFMVAVAGIVGVSAFNKNLEDVVGYIDGQAVKAAQLQNYVNELLGSNYQKKMDTAEGRQELFNHYVNRKLLLEYAKENIETEDSFVVSHTMGEVSEETALISAVLKKEVNDKVQYTEEDVKALMAADARFTNMQDAEREVISQKRVELFYTFMEKVKSNHKIELAG
jgi:hypothetical protein